MEQLPDKNKDPLSRILNSSQLESPSPNFTKNIMHQLGVHPAKAAIKTKPIISSSGWILISLVSVFIFLVIIFGGDNSTAGVSSNLTHTLFQQAEGFSSSLFQSSIMLYISMIAFSLFSLSCVDALIRRNRLNFANY